ncbi:unnamed protein product [Diplocarpon coronariae]|uniref:Uncharacterized protein n=1 Tax=Diplocarpon coronariae TaxID=2795749 RepID=A0A218YWG1_9HELO|nr:hypothetical protein B2J93_6846 [Marssonina coronariae]
MCYWYTHVYSCKHVTSALGKYCSKASLVQTPCKKKNIWQTIRMGEDCEDCAMPEGRGNNVVENGDSWRNDWGLNFCDDYDGWD